MIDFARSDWCKRKAKGTYFPNLHTHTGIGSLGDGFGTVDMWMDALERRGLKHHFITDHGTLAAIPWMYNEGKKRGIHIHPGMEGYIIPEYDGYRVDAEGNRLPDGTKSGGTIVRHKYKHITLIPMNETGWKNLIKINNISWLKGRFRGRGRFDFETLFKYNEGLICMSACISGIFSQMFSDYYFARDSGEECLSLKGCRKEAGKMVRKFKKVFGDRLYIELMIFHAKVQVFVNKELVKLIREYDIEPVITNDCHYPEPEHSEFREIMREFKYKSSSTSMSRETDTDNAGKDFSRPEFYPRSVEDIKYTWENAGYSKCIKWGMIRRGILNTIEVTKRCRFEMDTSLKLPAFDVKSHSMYKAAMALPLQTLGSGENDKLFVALLAAGYRQKIGKKLSVKKWKRLLAGKKTKADKYLRQAAYEYKVIHDAGFVDYFLIVEDIIRYCMVERGQLYGQGRGSTAGSVISWLFGISRDDPIKFGLYFERFMNPGRLKGELPDIDMDFMRGFRDEIKRYIERKYGADRVASIGTIGVVRVKSAIQKVASAQDFLIDGIQYTFHKIQQITHTIPTAVGGGVQIQSLEDAISVCQNNPENLFWKFYQKHRDWLDRYVVAVLDHPVSFGRHAAGLVISPVPIDSCIPIRVVDAGKKGTIVVSQWRDKDLIPLGFLKLDILGLNTLDQIQFANKLIEKRHDIEVPDLASINQDDPIIYKRVIKPGRTMGIFQLNSPMVRRYLQELSPNKYRQVYTTVALLRPGPMGIKAHLTYIDLQKNKVEPHYDSKKEIPALKETGGLVIFQESAMQLCVDVAGFTLEEADTFRSVVGKKKLDKMPAQKKKFIEGAIKRGMLEKRARKIFAKIEAFAGYGFNKCLHSDELISMVNGSEKKIVDIKKGEWVLSRDETTQEQTNVEVTDIFKHSAELFEFILEDGRMVRCSMEHKYRVFDGRILPMHQIIKEDLELC